MESVEKIIKSKISLLERGTLLFPNDFNKLGSSEAVRIALHRLNKSGFIKRVAQGIYVRPKTSKYVGEVLPSAEEVVEAIAKRDKIRIVPTGTYALHMLGLSSQIPTKLVFLTDGSSREIKVGNRTIKFKKASPKNLLAKGEISSQVIQALRAIGKEALTKNEIEKIKILLQKEDPKDLEHDIELAPEWIKKIMKINRIQFDSLEEEERRAIYEKIAEETGMTSYAVEKDWWVVQTLSIIFSMDIGKSIVFKGGTSLSKAWNLIARFSEDIDFAIDRKFFDFEGELSKSQITKLRKKASVYITEVFYPALEIKFREKGFRNIEFKLVETKDSDQDPRIIEIYYPSITQTSIYIKPRVQVEIGCRSLREPFNMESISSLVDEYYPDAEFNQAPVMVPTVNPSRTFLEKLFLLHEEFQRPVEKIRTDRLSRHLYDVYQLSSTEYAEEAIKNKELYEVIVRHRYKFSRVGGVNYNLHQPQLINPIPPIHLEEAWKKDYRSMQEEMIYGQSPSFEEMLQQIKLFLEKMKALDWTMDLEFPFKKH
ncbi:DUF6088 family protein [Aureispira sp. CCB-E]|uniref:DUF6088 family protein n=1 Tax=Aureispira sp. CCB-E TaxID=3051121 RepID=UPI0028692D82|nr:DUF6088 family protein [Aureispira sp. CCB-E]WMX14782.1 DUF6088 family protein [Aureispira sp. CCB-E]